MHDAVKAMSFNRLSRADQQRSSGARGMFAKMKIVPVIKCSDLARSIAFYTRTLDFELADPNDAGPVIEVIHATPSCSCPR